MVKAKLVGRQRQFRENAVFSKQVVRYRRLLEELHLDQFVLLAIAFH